MHEKLQIWLVFLFVFLWLIKDVKTSLWIIEVFGPEQEPAGGTL